jgi:tubulin polyglutamylase TTLL1
MTYGKKYNFRSQIMPTMRKMGQDAAKSIYTKVSPGNPMNNFEIFGLDFMIDKNFEPWLI